MKNLMLFLASTALLLSTVGCSNTEEQTISEPTPDTVIESEQTFTESSSDTVIETEQATVESIPDAVVEDKQATVESTPAFAALSVSDLKDALDAMDLAEANLINHSETDVTYPANAAIRAESYIEELKNFTWEECAPPVDWDGSDNFFCQLTASDVTITAFQGGHDSSRPLHLITDHGEGWFSLPYVRSEPTKAVEQANWMIYDTFFSWCLEAETAARYGAGGIPLTAEELDYFQEYTISERMEPDEEYEGYSVSVFVRRATEISCFFTSQYSDPRDINAAAFLAHCPHESVLERGDGEEFHIVQKKLDWRGGEIRRIPRTYLNEILMKYAGITVEEMHTDWTKKAFYVSETDCFYTFINSVFSRGKFMPCYGEKNGDIVTLWEEFNAYDGKSYALTLQNDGENWRILSRTEVIN